MIGESPPSRFAQAMRWAGGVGIVVIAVMRCVISFAPQIVFDIDPALDPTPLAGLGPGGSLLLDALLLLACACALVGEVLTKRGVDCAISFEQVVAPSDARYESGLSRCRHQRCIHECRVAN